MNKEAVIDRIVDGKHIVLLVGDEEKEYIVSNPEWVNQLSEGDWVTIALDETDNIIDVKPNPELSKQKRSTIQDKLSLLKNRKKSKFINK